MSEKTQAVHEPEAYFIATFIGILLALVSLGVGVIFAFSNILDPALSAAWAWAIGAGTSLHIFPWVKEAFE